jgi:5-methyltetrahydrofolate--homocysteine methyltransferase
MEVLKPLLVESNAKPAGTIVIGTVKGDMHDIGKNLVSMMLQGAGFEVIDLGIDVPPERFIQAIKDNKPGLAGMSALLTTTMPQMKTTIAAIAEAGLRDHVKILVGGAPVTDGYAKKIGADGFSADASGVVPVAKRLLGQ